MSGFVRLAEGILFWQVQETGSSAASTADGVLNVLYFGAFIAVNLAVMNMLPIPALDGGRILFLLIEAVRRKPMDIETESKLQFLGFVFLMGLMAFVIFSDIKKYMI